MRPLATFLAVAATIIGAQGATLIIGSGDPNLGPKLIAVSVVFAALAAILVWAGAKLAERQRQDTVRAITAQHRSGSVILGRMRPSEASQIRGTLTKEQADWKIETHSVITKMAPRLLPEWEHPPATNMSAGVPDRGLTEAADDLLQRLHQLTTFMAHLRR